MVRTFDTATSEVNESKEDIFEIGGSRIAFAVDYEFAQDIVNFLNDKYKEVK